ncbi:MAG: sigma-70 family RNA polymerase sigma factor [Sedimentisphaerales bacterium]|nr:sigma-70 family RNA polymerase sigma factor [Sedimentisphaerales bacterium]
MKTDPLVKIIKRCQNGDPDAFAWLLSEFGPKLRSYFLRALASADDADDMLQELFLKLLIIIRRYKHRGRFESWLFCVAANLVRDRYRTRQRRIKTVSLPADDATYDSQAAAVSREPNPHRQMETAEQLDQLQHALDELSLSDREIVLLRHYGGLSFKELAEHFQIPTGTALARVHRGLKKLNKLLT